MEMDGDTCMSCKTKIEPNEQLVFVIPVGYLFIQRKAVIYLPLLARCNYL